MEIVYVGSTVMATLGFYRLRCSRPFIYGACEVAVALAIIVLTFDPHIRAAAPAAIPPTTLSVVLSESVGVLTGIYVFVRGMDNMRRDLPYRWRSRWASWFPVDDA
ncbi:MAG TPA: hypothetical protein VG328_07640 [Stellaceae bacterium]|nr:hypothetical protein [Stellaceae bacterium]